MNKTRPFLVGSLVFGGLALMSYFGTTLLSGPLGMLFRSATGLNETRGIAQAGMVLAGLGVFVAAAIVAVATALQPSGLARKLLLVIPAVSLAFVAATTLGAAMGVGTVGPVTFIRPFGDITLSSVGVTVAGVLSLVTVGLAASLAKLNSHARDAAMTTLGVSSVPMAVAVVALLASVAIVSSSQPTFPQRPGGPQGQAPTQQGGPPPGPGGPGGPGGPASAAALQSNYATGGALTAVLGGAMVALSVLGVLAKRRARLAATNAGETTVPTPVNLRRESSLALVGFVAVSGVALLASQFVPVTRTNPPVTAPPSWDSAQTEELFVRTCGNCHSNETRWPWYASFAPSSWVTVAHVNAARDVLNLSEIGDVPLNRRAMVADNMRMRIEDGSMPPADYQFMHHEARLTEAEKQQLIAGLRATLSR